MTQKDQALLRTPLHWQSRIDQMFKWTWGFVDVSLLLRRREGAEGKTAHLAV